MEDVQTYLNIFKPTPVFEWNYRSKADLNINQGGTSSGKTYSILQVLLLLAITNPRTDTLIVGQDMPNLKIGPIKDFKKILEQPLLKASIKKYNATDKKYLLYNGSTIQFKSIKTQQDAKSGKRDFLFVNEANGIPLPIFKELYVRTERQTFIDYNPTAPFWAHNNYIGTTGVNTFFSNYKHNPFVSERIVRKIEAYKKDDPMRWKVYGLGLTGAIEGVIFDKIRWIDKFPAAIEQQYYGMDFGYANDPTTLVRSGRLFGELYAELLLYEKGLNAKMIAEHVQPLHLDPFSSIHCDSADPRLRDDIAAHGVSIMSVAKPGLEASIMKLTEEPVINIVANRLFKFEQQNYTWQFNNRTGEFTNKPIDKHNHIWDALRYSMEAMNGGGAIISTSYF